MKKKKNLKRYNRGSTEEDASLVKKAKIATNEKWKRTWEEALAVECLAYIRDQILKSITSALKYNWIE